MKFVEASLLQDIAPGKSRPVRLGSLDVVLCNVEGSIHALENGCLHAGAALSGGRLCGKVLACPVHGWRYDVTTGSLLAAPERGVRRFPVKVADGKVYVEIEA